MHFFYLFCTKYCHLQLLSTYIYVKQFYLQIEDIKFFSMMIVKNLFLFSTTKNNDKVFHLDFIQ